MPPAVEPKMKSRSHPYRRPGHVSALHAWGSAMLALAPLSVLGWAVYLTGMGIA